MKVQHSKATTSSIFPPRLSKPLYWQPGVNFLSEAQQCDTTVVGAAASLPFSRAKSAKMATPIVPETYGIVGRIFQCLQSKPFFLELMFRG